jgi:hypothetical protein
MDKVDIEWEETYTDLFTDIFNALIYIGRPSLRTGEPAEVKFGNITCFIEHFSEDEDDLGWAITIYQIGYKWTYFYHDCFENDLDRGSFIVPAESYVIDPSKPPSSQAEIEEIPNTDLPEIFFTNIQHAVKKFGSIRRSFLDITKNYERLTLKTWGLVDEHFELKSASQRKICEASIVAGLSDVNRREINLA